ncbi:MAG: hypothetical protein GXC70_11170 [Sphingomonadaceae bacterium]|nr:hypothetical protein [Sphingomonadaceae bacterium]
MIAARFGIVALIPAMLNLTIAGSGGGMMTVQICTGDGRVHTVEVPLGDGSGGSEQGLCCAKGCHSGNNRKRVLARN